MKENISRQYYNPQRELNSLKTNDIQGFKIK